MSRPITIALVGLTLLVGFYGAALAQPYYVPPPSPAAQPLPQPSPAPQPAPQPRPAPGYVAPVPFGGLYNTISGRQPSTPGQQAPLTPFNATP